MRYDTPFDDIHGKAYLQHNECRFKHLDTLKINFTQKSILELGAGIGDHTENLLKYKPLSITSLEARNENLKIFRERFATNSKVTSQFFDLDNPFKLEQTFDISYCYGLLYHLARPESAIAFMAEHTKEILLLETCVDYRHQDSINLLDEDTKLFSQSYSGMGCRPGRKWLFNTLKKYFKHVYIPLTQPAHEQFPVDWTKTEEQTTSLTRAIFIASKTKLENPLLVNHILDKQKNK